MSHGEESAPAKGTQRLDKWLWFARFARTRTLATDLVQSGHVRLNRVRTDKPSQPVRVNDVLTLVLNRRVRLIRVLELGLRRGPAVAALALYEELTEPGDPPKPRSSIHSQHNQLRGAGHGGRSAGTGRPTKKERRDIDRLNGKFR